MAAIEVTGRSITGRVLVYGVPRPLKAGAETFQRGAFGPTSTMRGAPVVAADERGHPLVLATAESFTERGGALWGTWKANGGPRGDELLEDCRVGHVVAFDPDVKVLDQRAAEGWRTSPGVLVTRAMLVSVRATGLDVWPEGAELVEVRTAELMRRYGIGPTPDVDLSPLPPILSPYR